MLALLAAFTMSLGLTLALMPLFRRYALARPNARSSHKVPTPQGGGVSVIAATVIVVAVYGVWQGSNLGTLMPVLAAALGLALLGAFDDISPLPAMLRLVIHGLLAALALTSLDETMRLFPFLPLLLERGLLLVGLVWFVNLVNFMDGLDWLSVAAFVPILAFCALSLHEPTSCLALALLGALLGFAPFNKPVAKLFLGDVGSLPFGLLSGWMLILIAAQKGLIPAVLPILYYATDTGLTLMRRALKREKIWEAHREHAYQKATQNGLSVMNVAVHIFVLHGLLVMLALVAMGGIVQALAALLMGALLVAETLHHFTRSR